MIRRESRPTDREGGARLDARSRSSRIAARMAARSRRSSAAASASAARSISPNSAWRFSTHVGGWSDFPLTALPRDAARRARHHGQRRQRRRAGRGRLWRGPRLLDPLFYMTLSTGIGGGIYARWQNLARRRFLGGRDRPPDHPARWPRVPVRRARLFRAHVLRPVAGARLRQDREGTDARPGFRRAATWWISRWD